jgi:hypothetical protein
VRLYKPLQLPAPLAEMLINDTDVSPAQVYGSILRDHSTPYVQLAHRRRELQGSSGNKFSETSVLKEQPYEIAMGLLSTRLRLL